MKRAFTQARRRPDEVDFIELHATGTAQGDPTEANWVGEHFQRDGALQIGSVKGNIGYVNLCYFRTFPERSPDTSRSQPFSHRYAKYVLCLKQA